MSPTMNKQATITLTPVNFPDEPYPRVLHLTPSDPLIKIGRASRSASKNLHPGANNAWFDSPVMSREHAQITIISDTRSNHAVMLMDIGSMHGTKIDSRFLKKDEIEEITSGQLLTFGNEVARGPETFPPRQFRVFIEWSDWSPPTPADSSPRANTSPIRGYGLMDEDLMTSSDDSLSDNDGQSEHGRVESPVFTPKSPTAPVAVSTFVVPDSESSSPVNSDYEPPEEIQSGNEIEMILDSQEDPQVAHSHIITCQAELVGIEFSGPVGLTEQEKAEDEGLFLNSDSPERDWSPVSPMTSPPSENQQAMGFMCVDLNEELGNAKNPVVIEDEDQDSLPEPERFRQRSVAGDDGYSPPPADPPKHSPQHQGGGDDASSYSCDFEGHESDENVEEEMASDDGFDNEGWASHLTTEEEKEEEESEPEYYEESEAEDLGSDNEAEEELSQPDLEPSKQGVMEQALEKSKASIETTTKSPSPMPSTTKPTVLSRGSPFRREALCAPPPPPPIKEPAVTSSLQHLPPIQKIRVSEPMAPFISLAHLPHSYPSNANLTARAPSPSDAAMVKSSTIQTKQIADTLAKDQYKEIPSVSSGAGIRDAMNTRSSSALTVRRDGPFNNYNCSSDITASEPLRIVNARKLGEISGKHEYFKAREANREIFSDLPRSSANNSESKQSHLDTVHLELDPPDNGSNRTSEYRDYASTASEAGSFGELFTFPVDDIHQGERMPAASSAASAARFKNLMGDDVEQYDHNSSNLTPVDLDKPQERQELRSSSRVAIQNIVDPMDKETPFRTENASDPAGWSRLGTKRKADEISLLDSGEQPKWVGPQDQQPPFASAESPTSDAQPQESNVVASHEAVISFDASLQETQATSHLVVHPDEPMRKKAKLAEPKMGGLATKAAIALTAFVAGGIGMFAALVASAPGA